MKYFAPITDYITKSTYIKSIFYPSGYTSDIPNIQGLVITTLGDRVCTYFHIPNEVKDISESKLILDAIVTKTHIATIKWNFSLLGEAYNTNNDTESNYSLGSLTANIRYGITMPSGFTSNLSANDFGGLEVEYADVSDDVDVYVQGLYIKYSVRETG